MILYLDSLDIALLISGIGALLVGAIIFFIVGIYKVKPKHVIIIERVNTFYKVVGKGFHFFMPLVYKKVGTYCIAPMQEGITLDNGNKLYLTYQITDPQTYHYKGIDVGTYLNKINKLNETITTELLEKEFLLIGIKFISVKK